MENSPINMVRNTDTVSGGGLDILFTCTLFDLVVTLGQMNGLAHCF